MLKLLSARLLLLFSITVYVQSFEACKILQIQIEDFCNFCGFCLCSVLHGYMSLQRSIEKSEFDVSKLA